MMSIPTGRSTCRIYSENFVLVVSVRAVCPMAPTATRLTAALGAWLGNGSDGGEPLAALDDTSAERRTAAKLLYRQMCERAAVCRSEPRHMCAMLRVALRTHLPRLVRDVLRCMRETGCTVFVSHGHVTAGFMASAWSSLDNTAQQQLLDTIAALPLQGAIRVESCST
jgi:hypothetical protein